MTQPCLLIIDDEPIVRASLGALLAGEDYQLNFAVDGAEGMEKAIELHPDVILLDVMMPSMDGYEVCHRLRSEPFLEEIPILLLTALDDRDSRLRGLEAGADDFLTKPVERLELRARLRTITRLDRYRKLNQERLRIVQTLGELQRAYDETIEGWSRALDLRDKETEGHSRRVTEVTLKLARAFGIDNEEELVNIRRGALLHDVGKLGIPDAILYKPDTLSEVEMEIMRKHPTYAYEMLSPIAYLRPSLDIPYCHHEKWDGSGYPRGLRGEDIPLSARLFSISDIWDALLSDRPYRVKWPKEKAYQYIQTLAGTHLDQQVVTAFNEIIETESSTNEGAEHQPVIFKPIKEINMNETYPQTSLAIRSQQQHLAEMIVQRQYLRQTKIWQPMGAPGMEKSVRDAGYHLTYLAEALGVGEPTLFTEYLAWVKTLFAGLKFHEDVLPTILEITHQVLSESLAVEDAQPALEYLDAGMQSLCSAPSMDESIIHVHSLLSDLASRYLAALLGSDRRAASAMILQAVQSGTAVKDIYLNIFQPSQREIGRLWQTNLISVAQEHFCTAVTQIVMSQLYPYIFTGERKDRRMVVACVGGELHELGARMVADFFEMDGWDTYFLGANTPPDAILETVHERQAEILSLSATMTFHVSRVAEIIAALQHSDPPRAHVLVGGYPFNLSPTLWQQVGADGYAPDAQAALAEAERILQK